MDRATVLPWTVELSPTRAAPRMALWSEAFRPGDDR